MSDSKRIAVFGIYPGRDQAETGVDILIGAGFTPTDISALYAQSVSMRDFTHEKHTKAPEGTAAGAAAGGALGGTLGLLAGAGALVIPGLGPFLAAGPLMGALAGLGAGGAVGGLIGGLSGLGIPEYEAKRYEGRVSNGGVLLSVHCDSSEEISVAKDVLRRSGAGDIASAGEQRIPRGPDDGSRTTRM